MTMAIRQESYKVEAGRYKRKFRDDVRWSVWKIISYPRWNFGARDIEYEAHRNGVVKMFKTKDEAVGWATKC